MDAGKTTDVRAHKFIVVELADCKKHLTKSFQVGLLSKYEDYYGLDWYDVKASCGPIMTIP